MNETSLPCRFTLFQKFYLKLIRETAIEIGKKVNDRIITGHQHLMEFCPILKSQTKSSLAIWKRDNSYFF